jgi:hypothetical protein
MKQLLNPKRWFPRDWMIRAKLFTEGVYFWQRYTVTLCNPATSQYITTPYRCPSNRLMLDLWAREMMSENINRSKYFNQQTTDEILVTIKNRKGYVILDEIGLYQSRQQPE